jgi:hypothetical protein
LQATKNNPVFDRCRVARWFNFKPKIPLWVNFVGPWNGKGLYILMPIGIYHGHLVHFESFGNLVEIWYLFPRFGIHTVSRKIWQPWTGDVVSDVFTWPLILANF